MSSSTLTREDFNIIMQCGGKITFTPLKRNRLKCNQVPRLTRLTAKKAEMLRRQFGAMRKSSPQKKTITAQKLREVHIDRWGEVSCPRCGRWTTAKNEEKISCQGWLCDEKFIAVK